MGRAAACKSLSFNVCAMQHCQRDKGVVKSMGVFRDTLAQNGATANSVVGQSCVPPCSPRLVLGQWVGASLCSVMPDLTQAVGSAAGKGEGRRGWPFLAAAST